jgi:N-acetylmuramoyl-L-alanine amidase
MKPTLISLLVFSCLLTVSGVSTGWADTAADLFFEAEACQRKLDRNPAWQKYRHRWMQCIEQFQAVYRRDPNGPWAAAGLYMTGKLYADLYRRSGRLSDQKESVDHFERIIKRFPDSAYRQRAEKALQSDSRETRRKADAKPPRSTGGAARAVEAKNTYHEGEACYHSLRNNPERQKYRDSWLPCIRKFEKVYELDPEGPWASAGLYMAASLYYELYKRSYNEEDKNQALAYFKQVVRNYPDSAYRQKANDAMAALDADGELDALLSRMPGSSEASPEETPTPDGAGDAREPAGPDRKARVTGLRYWSSPDYTRLVIDTDRETEYTYNELKKDPSIHKPRRLYVDLQNCRLGEDIQRVIPIDDDLLTNARAGQFTHDAVRVVVDIKSIESFDVFSLKEPFRIVMDIRGQGGDGAPAPKRENKRTTAKIDPKASGSDLARQLNLGISRIVVDPGHGGKDYGAPGYLKGVHEKKITLQIAKRLAAELRKELKCEVLLTRTGDRYLTLEERTAFANTKNADLFISVHTNANRDSRAYGISTYFLNFSDDDESKYVAAMENATSTKNISDLEHILFSLIHYSKLNESSRLAAHIQDSMAGHLKAKGWPRIKNKGVKQAPFYVLMGARMPSILIETSFISNPRECRRLINPQYQQRLAEGIVQGIKKYIREMNPTALQPARSAGGRRG